MTHPRLRLLIAAVLLCALVAVATHRPAARADDKAAPAPGTVAALLSGTPYPATLKAVLLDTPYRQVDLVDAQGKLGTYITKGDTTTAGGETFLVAYFAPPDPGTPAGTTAVPRTATLHLALINMRFVQAMTNPRPVSFAP